MINHNLKPIREYVRFSPATEARGKLRIGIKIYDRPIMLNETAAIYTHIIIEEEETNDNFKPFGALMYEVEITEEQVKEAFTSIMNDPENFKSV